MTFECHVVGRPEPVVKWFREGTLIQHSPDYHVSFNNGISTLIIMEVFPEDSGKFKCTATNASGGTTTEANLRVERKCLVSTIMICIFYSRIFFRTLIRFNTKLGLLLLYSLLNLYLIQYWNNFDMLFHVRFIYPNHTCTE